MVVLLLLVFVDDNQSSKADQKCITGRLTFNLLFLHLSQFHSLSFAFLCHAISCTCLLSVVVCHVNQISNLVLLFVHLEIGHFSKLTVSHLISLFSSYQVDKAHCRIVTIDEEEQEDFDCFYDFEKEEGEKDDGEETAENTDRRVLDVSRCVLLSFHWLDISIGSWALLRLFEIHWMVYAHLILSSYP